MRSRARASHTFSIREMVDREHSSRSDGGQVERHLEYRIDAKTVGVVAVLVAGGDHQEAEADDVGESVRDLIRCALILDPASKTISDAQPLLDPRAASGRRRPMTTNHHRMLQRRICRRQVTGRATAA